MVPMNLEILSEAERLDLGPFGFFQDVSPQAATFVTALGSRDYSRGDVEKLMEGATYVGRIYAACLLRAIDPAAGRAALLRLTGDNSPLIFRVPHSCGKMLTTVAKCADWFLAEPSAPIPSGRPKSEDLARWNEKLAQMAEKGNRSPEE